MQMICALLVFQTPELPAPLRKISPWLDWLVTPREDVFALLEGQRHRRVIKTHTPLDGIPLSPLATYIVVGRHPLDAAVSLYHQGSNINRERLAELTGKPTDQPRPDRPARPPVREWLLRWIDADDAPVDYSDSLRGALWHISDAWARRADPGLSGPTILLIHYEELAADLEGQMRWLASALGIEVAPSRWPDLVRAATFESMRAAAMSRAPQAGGVLKDPSAFFRRGTSGAGQELLTVQELAHYHERAAVYAPPEVLAWLHQSELRQSELRQIERPDLVGCIRPWQASGRID